jgi:Bacterial Ig-like domain (group 3)/FG-GAP-like repeat
MRTKLSAWLQSASFLVLAVTTAHVQGQAQSAKSAKAFAPNLQAGTGIPLIPATPAQHDPVNAIKMMTPFDRVIAPHMAQFMSQGTKSASAATPRSAAIGTRSSAIGVGGGNVNFPGFVGAAFLTINDGDRSIAYNSVSGDFNHDGRMDVATIKTDGTIDVILNPGSFANINNLTPITSNNNGNPSSLFIAWVIVADMNGDGFPDLVGQDIENSQIVVWIGKGDGTFGAPNLYPVTLPPGVTWFPGLTFGASIVVGDFNGDGSLDVAAVTLNASYAPGGSTTAIIEQTFLNVGQGRLSPLAVESSTFNDYYFTATYANSSVTTSDGINASSIAFLLQDAGITDSTKQGMSIATMASNGDGTFKPATEPPGVLVQNTLISVDGSFISTNLGANVTSHPVNKINPPGTPGSGTPTTDIVFMTGDGAVYDAPFSAGNPTTAKLLVGLNTELFPFGISFVPPVTTPPALPSLISTPIPNEATINVADMNGDGTLDLIVYTPGTVNIFPNAGNGVFTAAPVQMAGAAPGLQQPQPANYDGGSYNSIVNVDEALGQVGYFQNLGAAASTQAGQFLAAPLITGTNVTGNFETFGANIDIMATADVNGDGVLDLIGLDLSNPLGNGSPNIVVGIRNGAGAGNQTSNYTFTTAVIGQSLALIANGLEFMEPVAITNAAGTSILLVTYTGGLYIVTAGSNGIFGAPAALNMGAQFDCSVNLNYADVGDINGDGIPDIVVAYSGEFSCGGASTVPSGYYTLLGNADGSFQPATFTALGSALYAVKLINFSGAPGNLDLAAIDQNLQALSAAVYVIPNKADGSGTFNIALATAPVINYIVSDIVVGDYNSDGKQDLTLTTVGQIDRSTNTIIPNTSGVLLLPGNGDYTFGTPTLINPGHFPLWGSYADFNGDGAPDLALVETHNIYTSDAFTSAVQVLPNLGGGTFGPAIYLMDSFLPGRTTFTSYTFTGNFTNSGGADLLVSGNQGTAEFVNRGVTTLALIANPTSPAQGVTVTLTANISQAVSAGVSETGSVSFSANGTLLGSTPVAGGIATLTTTALAVGSNTIAATYAGDSNHNQASASMKLTVAPVTPAFTLTATPATLTLTRGTTGTVTASLAANSTFSGTVTMGCSGAPSESTCIANPASITLLPGQSTPVSIVIATTPPNNSFAANLSGMPPWSGTLSGLGLAGVVFLRRPKRRRFSSVLTALAMVSLACGSAGLLNGCSGGGAKAAAYPGTTAGQYVLTVTATSGGVSQTQPVALIVSNAN